MTHTFGVSNLAQTTGAPNLAKIKHMVTVDSRGTNLATMAIARLVLENPGKARSRGFLLGRPKDKDLMVPPARGEVSRRCPGMWSTGCHF